MKRFTPVLLIGWLVLALAACDVVPDGAVATLAPTAAVEAGLPTVTPAPAGNGEAVAAAPTAQPATSTPAPAAATDTPAATPTPAASPTPEATPTATATPTPAPPPVYTYRVLSTYPHDPTAWTQGLVIDNGTLYEGTGRWGESSLREVALETGTVLRLQPLEDQYFGEGIAVFGDRIYQLTWQEQTGFIWDKATFELLDTFSYPHEGWGITTDGQRLIVSDGTSTIRFWDPATLQETGTVEVRDNLGPVNRLNELEYIDGEIWANIWLTDLIARISPETGDVLGYIDLSGLLETSGPAPDADVLNGIARDPATGRLYVTGKLWPALFEIEVVP